MTSVSAHALKPSNLGAILIQNIERVVLDAFCSVLQMRLRQQAIYPMCTLKTRNMIHSILHGEFKRQILIRIHTAKERLWSMYPHCVKTRFPKSSNENHPLLKLEDIRCAILKHHQLKHKLENIYFRRSILLWRTLRKYILQRENILCDSIDDIKIIWNVKMSPLIHNMDNLHIIAHNTENMVEGETNNPKVKLDSRHAIDIIQRGGTDTCPKSSAYHSCVKNLINELKQSSTSLSSTHYLQLIQSSQMDTKRKESVDQSVNECSKYEECIRSEFQKWVHLYDIMLQIMDKRVMEVQESMKTLRIILEDRSITPASISRAVDDLSTATDVYYAIQCFCFLEKMMD